MVRNPLQVGYGPKAVAPCAIAIEDYARAVPASDCQRCVSLNIERTSVFLESSARQLSAYKQEVSQRV